MDEETITAAEELEYILDLMSDLDLSPKDKLQDLINSLEAEAEDEEANCANDDE